MVTSCVAPPNSVEEMVRQEWQDLDHLLVQFRTSRSILVGIVCDVEVREEDLRDYIPGLLPELTRRGLVDVVEYDSAFW